MKKLFEEIETAVPGGGAWCTVEKASALATLILGTRPDVVVELGVWMGGSAIPMGIALRHLGTGTLIAVDAWSPDASISGQAVADEKWWGETVGKDGHEKAYNKFLERLKEHHIDEDRCVVHRQRTDDATVPAKIDVLHHDANHGPQAVTDIDRWAPAVRVGGYLIIDDLNWIGGHVAKARDRARELGFIDLYTLGTGCVMQRISTISTKDESENETQDEDENEVQDEAHVARGKEPLAAE